ncbi:fimbrial protein [Acinetobacter larvae]|uniref:Fimbrial-type adhesion domain-containing protein n=1 Tax=Acinetobacter larvae TaxID=1789224 RepID=A0A1B2M2R6_9GAMM|nr:fimbrial protein [Acinetobacter larvae]AOA59490.1 hypothetical protein BFG52_14795 [Acinetobacter larvae]
MYKKFLGLVMILCSSKAYSVCQENPDQPANFTAIMTNALSNNGYLQLSSQAVTQAWATAINGCSKAKEHSSDFTMKANTDLELASRFSKDGYTYYEIPASYITPTPTFKAYIAFSVKDNSNTVPEIWVNDPSAAYRLYAKTTGSNNDVPTRGIRLPNVRLLITGLGNAEGVYTISPIRLGALIAKADGETASAPVRLVSSTFKITKTTCVVNGGAAINVLLPTVRTTDFTSAGHALGDTDFTVTVGGCDASDTNKSLVALLTDNNSPSESNNLGLLKNSGVENSSNVSVQITDSNSLPLPIAPKLINSSNSFFNFGTITGGTVSKSFKARYYSNSMPVPATHVQAQATITLIYN